MNALLTGIFLGVLISAVIVAIVVVAIRRGLERVVGGWFGW